MRCLIIGGSRFIGLCLARKLLAAGHEITVFNRGNHSDAVPNEIRKIEGNRKDPDVVRKRIGGCSFDWVFDLCAYEPSDLHHWIREFDVRIGHYIFCSSVAVYDFSAIASGQKGDPIGEDHALLCDRASGNGSDRPQDPYGPYGFNKGLCESLLSGQGGFPVTAVRPAYVYGPFNYINRESYFFARVMADRPVFVPTAGASLLHFVHVDDLAELFVRAAGNHRAFGKVYNAAGRDAVSNLEFAKLCGLATGRPEPRIRSISPEVLVNTFSKEEYLRLRYRMYPFDTDTNYRYASDRAESELSWVPCHRLAEGLRGSFEWYRNAGKFRPEGWNDFSLDLRIEKAVG